MAGNYTLGIDIGTGSVKAVALDIQGRVLESEQEFYPTQHPQPSFSEQDPEKIFQSFLSVMEKMIRQMRSKPEVIGLSSAMHSLVVTDVYGFPQTPLIIWSDSRSADIAAELRHSPEGKRIYTRTGTPIHAMSPLCKIQWLRQNEPILFKGENKFISIKEYCWFRLFSEFAIDHSLASATGLFDIHTLKWNDDALNFAGIKTGQLSTPVSTSYIKSFDKIKGASRVSFLTGIPFCIGASDGCLANVGTHALQPGAAALTIGTSGAIRICVAKPFADEEKMFFNYILDEQHYICGGPVNNGGNVAEWLMELFFEDETEKNYSKLFECISQVAAGAEGLVCLPYLHGERAPVWNEKASGIYYGIKSFHNRNHFIRAALEGVCFTFRQLITDLEKISEPISTIHASGGFVHSREWLQLLSNVTNKKVLIQQQQDASATGAALVAMKSAGLIHDFESVSSVISSEYNPDKTVEQIYEKNYKVFTELYPRFVGN